MAFAVNAMIGTRAAADACSRRLISPVAANPSITGIWQSINTAS